jgi:hypothetical protein
MNEDIRELPRASLRLINSLQLHLRSSLGQHARQLGGLDALELYSPTVGFESAAQSFRGAAQSSRAADQATLSDNAPFASLVRALRLCRPSSGSRVVKRFATGSHYVLLLGHLEPTRSTSANGFASSRSSHTSSFFGDSSSSQSDPAAKVLRCRSLATTAKYGGFVQDHPQSRREQARHAQGALGYLSASLPFLPFSLRLLFRLYVSALLLLRRAVQGLFF